MPHHVHPYAHRIGTLRDWKSRWIAFGAEYQKYVKGGHQDRTAWAHHRTKRRRCRETEGRDSLASGTLEDTAPERYQARDRRSAFSGVERRDRGCYGRRGPRETHAAQARDQADAREGDARTLDVAVRHSGPIGRCGHV